ncbi:unnamed protein product, partial [Aphanomyces euteiches]
GTTTQETAVAPRASGEQVRQEPLDPPNGRLDALTTDKPTAQTNAASTNDSPAKRPDSNTDHLQAQTSYNSKNNPKSKSTNKHEAGRNAKRNPKPKPNAEGKPVAPRASKESGQARKEPLDPLNGAKPSQTDASKQKRTAT